MIRSLLAALAVMTITTTTFADPPREEFQPTWESLQRYKTPQWFEDAKFGIWAHWGPQCAPENGDWYARFMYMQHPPKWGAKDYEFHLQHYGHPSEFGFKDVINTWHAENWDPQKLLALYKRAGAQYFMALANHHDNFDNWDSKYQPWNSVNMGPKKNLIAGWAKAARDNGLRFGVSVHASHAWSWYEVAQGADEDGPKKGAPYDGKMSKADGKGKWWEGYDPQDLYAQNHTPGKSKDVIWEWDASKGSSVPDQAYIDKFYNRTIDLIDQYQPDLIYFDDTVLPLYPISDVGLKIASHFYNANMQQHGGNLQAVLFGKILDAQQRKCMVWDIERGLADGIQPQHWQTDTCIGNWHYDRRIFDRHGYKSAELVIHMLSDIVSKNGNLMLSIPVRSDGTIDDQEVKFLEELAAWMDVNREAIFGTKPWKVYGEGPSTVPDEKKKSGNFNEGNQKYTGEDLRFTMKGDALYVILMGWPADGKAVVKSLNSGDPQQFGKIGQVRLLGANDAVSFRQTSDGLIVDLPARRPCEHAYVLKVDRSDPKSAR